MGSGPFNYEVLCCNSTAVADCPIGTREDPWGISNTWMFTFFCIGDVWNHSSYFCSVSFYGRSAGGRKAMKNSKITPFEHCNLDLTNLINAMQPAALKNWIFIWFKLWVQILSCDVMCKIHRFAPWRLRLPSVFCQCLCKTVSSARQPFTETLTPCFSPDFAFYWTVFCLIRENKRYKSTTEKTTK